MKKKGSRRVEKRLHTTLAMKAALLLLAALAAAASAKGARRGSAQRALAVVAQSPPRRQACVGRMPTARRAPQPPSPSTLPPLSLPTEINVDWKLPSLQKPPLDALAPLTVDVGDTLVFEWKGGLSYMLYRIAKRERQRREREREREGERERERRRRGWGGRVHVF